MAASDQTGATEGFSHIRAILESLEISDSEDVRTEAQTICQSAIETTLAHGLDDVELESAALCLAFRIAGEPFGAKDVSEVVDLSKQEIRKTSWKLNSILPIEVPPHSPHSYIDRYADELGLTEDTQRLAHDIFDACPPHFKSGTPTGIAASAIYGASSRNQDGLTQREIAELADVSEVTIRNWYSEQLEHYDASL